MNYDTSVLDAFVKECNIQIVSTQDGIEIRLPDWMYLEVEYVLDKRAIELDSRDCLMTYKLNKASIPDVPPTNSFPTYKYRSKYIYCCGLIQFTINNIKYDNIRVGGYNWNSILNHQTILIHINDHHTTQHTLERVYNEIGIIYTSYQRIQTFNQISKRICKSP